MKLELVRSTSGLLLMTGASFGTEIKTRVSNFILLFMRPKRSVGQGNFTSLVNSRIKQILPQDFDNGLDPRPAISHVKLSRLLF